MKVKSEEQLNEYGKLYRAVLWMIATLASFTIMAVAARELTDTLDPFSVVFFRTLVAVTIVTGIMMFRGGRDISTRVLPIHVFRNTIHYLGNLTWIAGIGLIPLAQVFALEFSTPIWVAILAVIFLKEKLTIGKIVAISLGFAGVIIILRPGLIPVDAGSLSVLCAAICFATANVITKFLSKSDSPMTILFLMYTMQLPISGIGAYMYWTPPSWIHLPWILLVGLMSLTAHYSMTRSLRLADVTIVIPIDFLRMPIIAIIGYFLYLESFSIWIFLGAILIFCGNYYNIWYQRRKI